MICKNEKIYLNDKIHCYLEKFHDFRTVQTVHEGKEVGGVYYVIRYKAGIGI
jgi:hypothetical protein